MPDSFNKIINILVPAIVISLGSVVILRSIAPTLAIYQLIFAVVGLLFTIIISRLSLDLLKVSPWFWYLLTLVPLLLTELFGVVSRGSARWIVIAGFRFQTSEFAKISLLLFAASWLSRRTTQSGSTTLRFLLLMALPAIIVYLQPDLGTAIMYAVIASIGLISAGTPIKHFGVLLISCAIALPILVTGLKPYQFARLESFVSPQKDPLGAGYNARQATIAIGSGQLVGRGIGQGTQSHLRFLPERQTDFAFASFVEELGFTGGLLLILAYLWLFIGILRVAEGATIIDHQLFCLLALGMLVIQTLINIGMNMGLLPITGITLPLFSYGGSSMLSTFIILSLIVNFAAKSSNSGKHLEIR